MRVGMVGVSWWTDILWPGFSGAANAEITWIAARSAEKARAFAERTVFRAGPPLRRAHSRRRISTPSTSVSRTSSRRDRDGALAGGKHVLQEKPMALTVKRPSPRPSLASRRGLTLMVNQELRLANGVADLPRAIDELARPT